jgi:hypothetical protein
MEKQLKVKILPETYPFSPRMDHKSKQENATNWVSPHGWNGSVSCPNSPLASMISNVDELSPPSAFLKSQTYFRNHSSGQNILSRNRNASQDNTKFVFFADANIRRHVGGLENFTHHSETIKPIYSCNKNCAEIDFDPTSPKISCMGHITYKNKPINKGKDVEEKKHVITFRRMLLNARKKPKRRE